MSSPAAKQSDKGLTKASVGSSSMPPEIAAALGRGTSDGQEIHLDIRFAMLKFLAGRAVACSQCGAESLKSAGCRHCCGSYADPCWPVGDACAQGECLYKQACCLPATCVMYEAGHAHAAVLYGGTHGLQGSKLRMLP